MRLFRHIRVDVENRGQTLGWPETVSEGMLSIQVERFPDSLQKEKE